MQRARSLFSCLTLSILLFTACGGSSDGKDGKDGEDGKDQKSYANMKKLDLSKNGVKAFIHVPKKDPNKDIRPAKVSSDNLPGVLVSAGKVFRMRVNQAPPRKMKAIKADIKNMSGALKPKFVKEKDSLLIFKKSVPGTEKEMFGFYMVKEVGGKPFIFRSDRKGEFSRANVDLMIKSAKSIQLKRDKKAA